MRPISRRRVFWLPLCGSLALVLASCSREAPSPPRIQPVALSTDMPSVRPEFQEAKDFLDAVKAAEPLLTDTKSLKGIKEVDVKVTMSDKFVQNTYPFDCKNRLIQMLRNSGITVKDDAGVTIVLGVVGTWDPQGTTATYWIEIDVFEWGHFVRSDKKHYLSYARVWGTGRLVRVGSAVFAESFAQDIDSLESQLVNDWITANQ